MRAHTVTLTGDPLTDRTNVGRAYRAVRTSNGTTITDAAATSGAHRTYVSTFENGRTNLTLDTLARLANAAGAVLLVKVTEHDAEEVEPATPVAQAMTLLHLSTITGTLSRDVAVTFAVP